MQKLILQEKIEILRLEANASRNERLHTLRLTLFQLLVCYKIDSNKRP